MTSWEKTKKKHNDVLRWCARISELLPMLEAAGCPEPDEVGAGHLRWYPEASEPPNRPAYRGQNLASIQIWSSAWDPRTFFGYSFTLVGSRNEPVTDPIQLPAMIERFAASLKRLRDPAIPVEVRCTIRLVIDEYTEVFIHKSLDIAGAWRVDFTRKGVTCSLGWLPGGYNGSFIVDGDTKHPCSTADSAAGRISGKFRSAELMI